MRCLLFRMIVFTILFFPVTAWSATIQGLSTASGELSFSSLPGQFSTVAGRTYFSPTLFEFGPDSTAIVTTTLPLPYDTTVIEPLPPTQGDSYSTGHTAVANSTDPTSGANAIQTAFTFLSAINLAGFTQTVSVDADVLLGLLSNNEETFGRATSFASYTLEVYDDTDPMLGELLYSASDQLFLAALAGAGSLNDDLNFATTLDFDIAPGEAILVQLSTSVVSGAVPTPIPAGVWLFGSALGLLGWLRSRRIS